MIVKNQEVILEIVNYHNLLKNHDLLKRGVQEVIDIILQMKANNTIPDMVVHNFFDLLNMMKILDLNIVSIIVNFIIIIVIIIC